MSGWSRRHGADDRYRIRFFQDHGEGPLWFHIDCDPRDRPTPSPPLEQRLRSWCEDCWQAELDGTDFRQAVRERLWRRAQVLARHVEQEFGPPWTVDVG